MSCKLRKIDDPSSVRGWAYQFRYAYGGLAPMKFSEISYASNTPDTGTGLTWQLLIKAARTDADVDAIVNETSLTVNDSPLVVGYSLDTTLTGFERGGTYPGELWVTDPSYGRQLVNEFLVDLSDPVKQTFP